MSTAPNSRAVKGLALTGAALIVLVGVIHLVDAPDSFGEAAYKGALFAANGVAAAVAAVGVLRGSRWGWHLGVLVSAGAFLGYVVSRTLGLPGLPPDEWMEPLGVASLIAEALFVAVYLRAISGARGAGSSPPAETT